MTDIENQTAPRVTLSDIEAEIVSEHYFTAEEGRLGACEMRKKAYPCRIEALSLLTFCVLVLKNGFTVTGESACVSPENFDAELGRKLARENAISQIWPLMGFMLREKLHRQAQMQPTYYVTHPDGSFNQADPQPVKL